MTKLNKNYILILLSCIFFMGMAGTDIYVSALPLMVKEFETTPNVVNLTISIYTIGVAIFVLFADVLSNRFGRKPVIVASVSIFTITSFLISVSTSIWFIISLRFIQSMAGFIFISSRQVLKDIMNQREQIRANGIILAGLVLSPALAPVVGAYLTNYFGWRSCFVFNGLIGSLLLSLTLKILPETNKSKLEKLPKLFPYIKSYLHILGDIFFIDITIIYGSASGAFWAFIGISSYLFINQLGVTPVHYSYVYLFMAVAYLAGNQFMLALNRFKCSYNKIIGLGVFCTLAGAIITLLGVFFSSSLAIVILVSIGSALMRAANALTNPTTQVITLNYFKTDGGLALGIAMSFNYIMMSSAIAFVTLFHSNPLTGLIISSLLFAGISLLFFLLARRKISKILEYI